MVLKAGDEEDPRGKGRVCTQHFRTARQEVQLQGDLLEGCSSQPWLRDSLRLRLN